MAKAFFAQTRISKNKVKTPEGFLLCLNVPIGRTGEMEYLASEVPIEPNGDGKVIIERIAEDLFSPETIASFEGKPFTILHPQEFVDPSNWSTLAKGVLQNVRRGVGENEQDLVADILVTDAEAIRQIESGERDEVSCGYENDFIELGPGRARQVQIRGNHCALVDEGRAGPTYAIIDHKPNEQEDPEMKLSDFKKLFIQTMDAAEKAEAEKAPSKDEEKKPEEKMKDADGGDMGELKAMLAMVMEMLQNKTKAPAAADEKSDKPVEKKEELKDEEPMTSAEERIAALEAQVKGLVEKVSKVLEAEAAESEVLMDEEYEEEEEETEDEMEEEVTVTGDSKSRAEILVPGIEMSKDETTLKTNAVKAFYKTADGKAIIESLNGGKAPDFKSADTVSHLFVASSEIVKARRSSDFLKTKMVTSRDSVDNGEKIFSTDQVNAINAKHYGLNQ